MNVVYLLNLLGPIRELKDEKEGGRAQVFNQLKETSVPRNYTLYRALICKKVKYWRKFKAC